jgi:hypothetical protein
VCIYNSCVSSFPLFFSHVQRSVVPLQYYSNQYTVVLTSFVDCHIVIAPSNYYYSNPINYTPLSEVHVKSCIVLLVPKKHSVVIIITRRRRRRRRPRARRGAPAHPPRRWRARPAAARRPSAPARSSSRRNGTSWTQFDSKVLKPVLLAVRLVRLVSRLGAIAPVSPHSSLYRIKGRVTRRAFKL